MVDDLPPEAYEHEARRAALAVPLRGYFERAESGRDVGTFLRVNMFSVPQRSIDSACMQLPEVDPAQPLELVAELPKGGRCIAVVLELATSPDPALLGLDVLDAFWWQGTVGAPRAEAVIRANGKMAGYVIQNGTPL